MTWQIDTPLRVCGGYDEGEEARGIPADWEAWLVLRREGKRVVHMHLQFSSIGVPREEAEQFVTDALNGLNGGADLADKNRIAAQGGKK